MGQISFRSYIKHHPYKETELSQGSEGTHLPPFPGTLEKAGEGNKTLCSRLGMHAALWDFMRRC